MYFFATVNHLFPAVTPVFMHLWLFSAHLKPGFTSPAEVAVNARREAGC